MGCSHRPGLRIDLAGSPPPNTAASKPPPIAPKQTPAACPKKKKLSYKEQQEYNTLEPAIEALEKEKDTLEAELSTGTLEYALLNQKSERVAEILKELDAKLERWMELDQYA